jgi:hypothetical protein
MRGGLFRGILVQFQHQFIYSFNNMPAGKHCFPFLKDPEDTERFAQKDSESAGEPEIGADKSPGKHDKPLQGQSPAQPCQESPLSYGKGTTLGQDPSVGDQKVKKDDARDYQKGDQGPGFFS